MELDENSYMSTLIWSGGVEIECDGETDYG